MSWRRLVLHCIFSFLIRWWMHGAEWRMEEEWNDCCGSGCVLSEWLSDYRGRLAFPPSVHHWFTCPVPLARIGQTATPHLQKCSSSLLSWGTSGLLAAETHFLPSLQPVAFVSLCLICLVAFCLRFSCLHFEFFFWSLVSVPIRPIPFAPFLSIVIVSSVFICAFVNM